MQEIQELLNSLQGQHGYLIAITSWMALCKIVFGLFNTALKDFMTNAMPSDKEWLSTLLDHRFYRISAWLINYIISIKLPATVDLIKKEQTEFLKRVDVQQSDKDTNV